LSLHFDRHGMWKGTRKLASVGPIIRDPTQPWPAIPWEREPTQPQPQAIRITVRDTPNFGLEVGVGIKGLKGNWGMTFAKGYSVVDVKRIAENLKSFSEVRPNEFPYMESLMEAISECSVHELVHLFGKVGHSRYDKWSNTDFNNLTTAMGLPIKRRMLEAVKNYTPPKRKVHTIRVIDLEGSE